MLNMPLLIHIALAAIVVSVQVQLAYANIIQPYVANVAVPVKSIAMDNKRNQLFIAEAGTIKVVNGSNGVMSTFVDLLNGVMHMSIDSQFNKLQSKCR